MLLTVSQKSACILVVRVQFVTDINLTQICVENETAWTGPCPLAVSR
jgi:hypothetical protein